MAFLSGQSRFRHQRPRAFAGFLSAVVATTVIPSPLPKREKARMKGPFARLRPRFGYAFAALCLFFFAFLPCRVQSAPPYPTHQVKAVFLFNFAQFVDWPTNSFEDSNSPLVIGVVGDQQHPVALALEQVVKNEKVRNRPFKIVYFPDAASVRKCHILYFPQATSAPSPRIFAQLQDQRILTIGENEDLLRNGGVIRFVTERKIGLRINLKAARASGLTISSKLLRLAEIVNY